MLGALRGLSIFAAVVALLIVLSGQETLISDFFKPGGEAERAVKGTAQNTISEANASNARQDMQILLSDSLFEVVGVEQVRKDAVFSAVRASEPGIPLGEPLENGGIALARASNSEVIYCAKPDASYLCVGVNPTTRDQQEATAPQMSAAISKVSSALK